MNLEFYAVHVLKHPYLILGVTSLATIVMNIPRKAGLQKGLDWRLALNKNRQGVAYFTGLKTIHSATPTGYFEFRCMRNDSKEAILREWEVWMECFRKSEFQGLRELGGKSHTAESDASAYLTNSILMSRKVDLLEINKEQLARNGPEMT
jgi:hypothetical protein